MSGLRFGLFVLDLTTSELLKGGRRVALQQQPSRVLLALLERPGELVTRDELRHRLWPDGTSVEFDQSLNKTITKLRDALGDTASNPRFIETLPKRGYRFIAPVTPDGPLAAESSVEARGPNVDTATSVGEITPGATGDSTGAPSEARPPSRGRIWMPWMIGGALAVAATIAAVTSSPPINPVQAREEVAAPRNAAEESPIHAARDAYDRGQLAVSRRTPESLKMSVELFERATTLSPRYAEAHAGLADSWSLMSSYGLVDPREGMPRARDAANRALTLNPSLARAHASIGRTAMIFDWDWTTAGWHFARAVELEPGHATTHQWHAYYLSALGRHDEAVDEVRRAVAAEPLSLNANTALGYVLYLARRYDESSFQLERTLEIDPDFAQARRNLALVRVQQGQLDEAVAAMSRVVMIANRAPYARAELAWLRARRGETDEARRELADLDRLREIEFVPPDALALVYAGLGAEDEAAGWLQRALAMRVANLALLPVEPVWDGLRAHPRVQQITAAIRPE